MERAVYCWGPLKRKNNQEKRKKKKERSLSLKFHGLVKNNSAKAIMVALIRVHEKGCLLLGTIKKEKKLREKKKEEREKLVA